MSALVLPLCTEDDRSCPECAPGGKKKKTDRTSRQTQAGIGHSAPAHRGRQERAHAQLRCPPRLGQFTNRTSSLPMYLYVSAADGTAMVEPLPVCKQEQQQRLRKQTTGAIDFMDAAM